MNPVRQSEYWLWDRVIDSCDQQIADAEDQIKINTAFRDAARVQQKRYKKPKEANTSVG